VPPTLTPPPGPAVPFGAGSLVPRLMIGTLEPAAPLALPGPARTPMIYARSSNPIGPGPVRPAGGDRSGLWLRNAAGGLCVLAAAAAAVSFTAQYRMVDAARHLPAVAALEAAIPDAAALVFACLGIALALHGRRALRPRALNLVSVGASVFMNAIAAAPGWRNLAIWAMPPIAYALASDTLITIVRTSALARHQHLGTVLTADQATPLALLGGLILWLLRLALAPASTLAGFRTWVLTECPVAPARRTPAPSPHRARVRGETKTSRFLSDQENRCQPERGSGPVRGRLELDPGQDGGSGPGQAVMWCVRVVCLGGLLVCGDGDGEAEGSQALEVSADLLVPVGVAGVPVGTEVAVAGLGVG
jgi:hypothetical protein